MSRDDFKQRVGKAAEQFKQLEGPVKLVSNLDADGITAGAIASKALDRAGFEHSTKIVHQLRDEELTELAEEDYDTYVFTDVGSGDLELVDSKIDGKCLILDHHNPHGEAGSDTWHVNPHLDDVNGSAEISASGVSFLFAQALSEENKDLAHLAVIGAIGDVQEDNGFTGLNQEIKETAKESGVLKVRQGLNLYGMNTRPLHKLLEYSSDVHIPGVSGSESGSIQFLQNLGISPKEGGEWRMIDDLSEEEKEKLTTGIIMKRAELDKPEDIFTKIYTLPHREGLFSDAKEFATLLNACGRLDKPHVGIGVCLDKDGFKEKALEVKQEYKNEIVSALKWYEDNQESEHVLKGDNYVVINAKDKVLNTIIGTIISIIAKSGDLPVGTFLLSMARKEEEENVTKVSIRVAGNPEGVHLREIIKDIAESVGGEGGGHQYAAGAIISSDKEDEFIEEAVEKFESL